MNEIIKTAERLIKALCEGCRHVGCGNFDFCVAVKNLREAIKRYEEST